MDTLSPRSLTLTLVALALTATLTGCGGADSVADTQSDDLTSAATTEDLFAIDVSKAKVVTPAQAKVIFKTKNPTALGDAVFGMRTRTCNGGVYNSKPNGRASITGECDDEDWVAETRAVFSYRQFNSIDVNTDAVNNPGTAAFDLTTSQGKSVARIKTKVSAGPSAYTWLFLDAIPGPSLMTMGVMLSQGSPTIGVGGFHSSLDAKRYVGVSGVLQLNLQPDGRYEERQYIVYARVAQTEHATLRAEGGHLYADW